MLVGISCLLFEALGKEHPFGLKVRTECEEIWRFVGAHILNGNYNC